MPPGYQHPARVAEKVAMLDLVSKGRVEFGTGETSSGAELGGFGVDRETKREQWDEALDVITRMFVEEPFAGWDGRFMTMPPRNVVPKPVQKPHPPLWVACSRRETIQLAAEKGIGALSFSFVEPEEAKEWVDEYYSIIESQACVPAGFAVNPNFAVVLPMMCHEDEATAIERGIDGAHFFGYSLAHYYVFGDHHPGRTNIWEEFQRNRAERGFARDIIVPEEAPLGVKIFQEGFGSLRGAIGTPEQIRDLCRRYEEAGVDQVIFVSQAGKNRHEHICESLELFAKEVMPEFAERTRGARAREAGAAGPGRRRRPAPPRPAAHRRSGLHDRADGLGLAAAAPSPDGNGRADGRAPALRRRLEKRGEAAFSRFVHRASDHRLERTVGSDPGLRVVFNGMARRFRPDKAAGFSGDIQYELAPADGEAKPWVVSVNGARASARPGRAPAPAVTIAMNLADFARLVGRDLDPGKALLEGKLNVEGDFNVLTKLGEMFGEPAP